MSEPTATGELPPETRCAECETLLAQGQDREQTPGGTFCRPCYDHLSTQLQQLARAQGEDVPYPRAVLGGLLGGALGAAVWWGFTVLTEVAFGLVAVVIGFTVGHGVVRLAGGKRSAGLQAVSVTIAALSFVYASYCVNRTFLHAAWAAEGRSGMLPLLPDPVLLFRVVAAGFDVMDVVFLAIVLWEAWKIPRPLRLAA